MKQIDIVFFDATSGHRTAAYALEKAFKQAADVRVNVLNLTDILCKQPFLRTLAKSGVDSFNWFVQREQVWFLRQQFSFFQTIQANVPSSMIQQVADFWRDNPPDMVISVLPICNLLLERAFHRVNPIGTYFILPVDFEEGQRNYWFDRRADAHYVNPTQKLVDQAEQIGIPSERNLRVTGMPIDPLFYDITVTDRSKALQELGLHPDNPTVLVSFGGQGSITAKKCAEKLSQVKTPINAIFLCGKHKQLYTELQALATPYRKTVLGYTPEAPAYYYHLADVLIGKPGSMTITEAIVTRTPLLAIKSQSLAPVQRGNEAWLEQSGVGSVITLEMVPEAVESILGSELVNHHIEREWHRGVFETAALLLRFVDRDKQQLNRGVQ
jgi:UDP-N-acetylglucosamine:LPS N-acetylglucosamine transferase